MPELKAIYGHTSTMGAFRYLTKGGRTLVYNYINMDAPVLAGSGDLPEYGDYGWGARWTSRAPLTATTPHGAACAPAHTSTTSSPQTLKTASRSTR